MSLEPATPCVLSFLIGTMPIGNLKIQNTKHNGNVANCITLWQHGHWEPRDLTQTPIPCLPVTGSTAIVFRVSGEAKLFPIPNCRIAVWVQARPEGSQEARLPGRWRHWVTSVFLGKAPKQDNEPGLSKGSAFDSHSVTTWHGDFHPWVSSDLLAMRSEARLEKDSDSPPGRTVRAWILGAAAYKSHRYHSHVLWRPSSATCFHWSFTVILSTVGF